MSSPLLSLVGYMAAHQRPDAALEFQTIIDHRAILVSDPIGAPAHLQLGGAFVLSGECTKAKTAESYRFRRTAEKLKKGEKQTHSGKPWK